MEIIARTTCRPSEAQKIRVIQAKRAKPAPGLNCQLRLTAGHPSGIEQCPNVSALQNAQLPDLQERERNTADRITQESQPYARKIHTSSAQESCSLMGTPITGRPV
jgi:hypothetical protein